MIIPTGRRKSADPWRCSGKGGSGQRFRKEREKGIRGGYFQLAAQTGHERHCELTHPRVTTEILDQRRRRRQLPRHAFCTVHGAHTAARVDRPALPDMSPWTLRTARPTRPDTRREHTRSRVWNAESAVVALFGGCLEVNTPLREAILKGVPSRVRLWAGKQPGIGCPVRQGMEQRGKHTQ